MSEKLNDELSLLVAALKTGSVGYRTFTKHSTGCGKMFFFTNAKGHVLASAALFH